MKNNVLISILETLTGPEWPKIHKFLLLNSRNDSDIVKLFLFFQENQHALPSIAEIQIEVFPDSTRKNVLNKCSLLKKQIERYLIFDQMNNIDDLKSSLLHESYIRRGLHNLAAKVFHEATESQSLLSQYDLHNSFYLHKMYHNTYFSEFNDNKNIGEQLLTGSQKALIRYSDLIAIYYDVERVNRLLNNELDSQSSPFLTEIQDTISNKYQSIFAQLLNMHKGINRTFENDVIQAFNKMGLNPNSEFFTYVIMNLIQHFIRIIKRGDLHQVESLIQLYEYGLKHEAFTKKGYISARRFGNIIDSACAYKRFEWANHVLKTYLYQVNPKIRHDTERLAQAQILFGQHQYKEVLNYIEDLKLLTLDHKLRYRLYKLACLLESKEFNRFDSFINSFKIHLRRTKPLLTPATFEGIKNFITITNDIRNHKSKIDIRQSIDQTKNLVLRTWLNQKASPEHF